MKFLLALLLAATSQSAFGQWSYQAMDAEKTAEIYAGIASGWHLQRRCAILSGPDAAALIRNYDAVTQELSGRLNREFLEMVRETSLEVVSEPPYASCGDDAKTAVDEAAQFAEEWVREISGRTSSGAQANNSSKPTPLRGAA